MAKSLAVKYRPKTFDEIVSQKSIIKILNKQLELNQVHNTYLFCGASGCGKTTTARAFANAINKNSGIPIEIDGASNNGVDNVRMITDDARERALDAEYKIYIIDECHMLSAAAWNAFLKCIEEPPKYTIFIFCTTDPQKIPDTIINRCMRFNFNKIPSNMIRDRLIYICEQEGFINYQDSCDYISKICKNQMRDAIALIEKASDYSRDLSINNVLEALGNYSYDNYVTLLDYINHNAKGMTLLLIDSIYQQGNDMQVFVDSFITFMLDVVKYVITHDFAVTHFPISLKQRIDDIVCQYNDVNYYTKIVETLFELKITIKNDTNMKDTIDILFIRMCGIE